MAALPVIEFRDVHKSFGALEVIRGINLTIERGSAVVICGPSGSGKSTLIRMVNRLEAPTRGEVLVDGVSSTRARGEALRRLRTGVGFVFQQFNLYPHMTARQNITLALRKVLRQAQAQADAVADEMLDQVGLAHKAGSLPGQLSGGQQQRVAIARALATEPDLLLFDEPTSALDPEMIGEVLTVIRQLTHRGITLVVVTHEMGFARTVADRIIFLDQGRVEEDAAPAEFFGAPRNPRTRQFLSQILSPLHTAGD
ncbi:MAG: amino acid ABC transporter ATP-binding protein [Holophaga sp.]|nr:amino acid ABC transporter ATP-binding protein [Holophaga sp.]